MRGCGRAGCAAAAGPAGTGGVGGDGGTCARTASPSGTARTARTASSCRWPGCRCWSGSLFAPALTAPPPSDSPLDNKWTTQGATPSADRQASLRSAGCSPAGHLAGHRTRGATSVTPGRRVAPHRAAPRRAAPRP